MKKKNWEVYIGKIYNNVMVISTLHMRKNKLSSMTKEEVCQYILEISG